MEEALSGRVPDLVHQARVGFGRYRQTAPSNVSDAQILLPLGAQFWAQLANLPLPQTAQHVPSLAPSLAVPAAVLAPSLAVPAAVLAPSLAGPVAVSEPALAPAAAASAAVPASSVSGAVPEEHPFQHLLAFQNLTNSALHALLARSGRGGDDALSGLLGSNAPDDLRSIPQVKRSSRCCLSGDPEHIRAIRENAKREMRASPGKAVS